MDHSPLQIALALHMINSPSRELVESILAVAVALWAIALRRRNWLIRSGGLLMVALGLALDVLTPLLKAAPGLMLGLRAAALILFMWGVIRLVLEALFTPRGREHYSPILRDLMMVLLWAVVAMVVASTTLGVNVTPLLAGSAVAGAVIGFGLQETLSNIFSGLALQIARPFEPGDWVRFKTYVGRVRGITLRSTAIVTRANERVEIPNSELSKDVLTNYSTGTVGDEIIFGLGYDQPPNRIKEVVLRVVRDIPHVATDPPPQILAWDYGDFAIKYRVKYWIRDYAVQEDARDALLTGLWYALRRNRIEIPYPVQTLQMRRGAPKVEAQEQFEEKIMVELRRVDFLHGLSDDELRTLVPTVNVHQFGAGEVLVRQGEEGDSFYIIRRGVADVTIRGADGATHHVAKVSPASPEPFFGEVSLLAGEPRNATIRACTDVEVLEMNRQGFAQLFKAHPELGEPMGEVVARRQTQRLDVLHEPRQDDGARGLRYRFLTKMREIFDF
ncbi:MAG: mechanosensitive ion channel family protein [Candidatus Binataceae bacterium]